MIQDATWQGGISSGKGLLRVNQECYTVRRQENIMQGSVRGSVVCRTCEKYLHTCTAPLRVQLEHGALCMYKCWLGEQPDKRLGEHAHQVERGWFA